MTSRRHAIPDFQGQSVLRSAGLAAGVIKREKVLSALKELCSLPPLEMTSEEFDNLGLSMHSPHGTGADAPLLSGARMSRQGLTCGERGGQSPSHGCPHAPPARSFWTAWGT